VPIPVLEVGGSHVTAATVDLTTATLAAGPFRSALDPQADAATLLDAFASTATHLLPTLTDPAGPWGLAVPGPFDYATGVARYQGVGKFGALNGVDVGKELAARLGRQPSDLHFLNDASAFGLGSWHLDPGSDGPARLVAITLGTGVGSAFVDAGTVVESGPLVPPQGRADLLTIDDHPLEDTVSTRAMVARYSSLTEAGAPLDGLQDLTRRASSGDGVAREVIDFAMTSLGTALAPWLTAFGARRLVFGGSITGAWSLIGPPLLAGLAAAAPEVAAHARITVTADTERTALLGAALHTTR
jgi:predicted NBD/HSP70 family sugar kinase